jgi:hypothetical protein
VGQSAKTSLIPRIGIKINDKNHEVGAVRIVG